MTLPSQARNYEEMGGGMTAEPPGYCTRYVAMALGMGVSRKADQDKTLVREPVTSSYKLGRKEKTDPRPLPRSPRKRWG